MGYWQTLLLLYTINVIGIHAGSWSFWWLVRRQSGANEPSWREAFSASWYAATGSAVAMLVYRPGA